MNNEDVEEQTEHMGDQRTKAEHARTHSLSIATEDAIIWICSMHAALLACTRETGSTSKIWIKVPLPSVA